MDYLVNYLTGNFPYKQELTSLGIAFQGALAVRNGLNKDNKLHFFHAFALSSIAGFGGGWLGFVWLGLPSSMITSDIGLACCIIAYAIVNWIPYDLGYKFGKTLPILAPAISLAQLFRSLGMIGFINKAQEVCIPTQYYPIAVIGPVVYGTLLGNMGGFLISGFNGHLQKGVPFAFQNGLVMGSFYHFFVHDKTGPVGTFLRKAVHTIGGGALLMGLDERTFAVAYVSLFMQITGLLQLPQFWGPDYSPFDHARTILEKFAPNLLPSSATHTKFENELLEELDDNDTPAKAKESNKQDAQKKKKRKKKTS